MSVVCNKSHPGTRLHTQTFVRNAVNIMYAQSSITTLISTTIDHFLSYFSGGGKEDIEA